MDLIHHTCMTEHLAKYTNKLYKLLINEFKTAREQRRPISTQISLLHLANIVQPKSEQVEKYINSLVSAKLKASDLHYRTYINIMTPHKQAA